MLFGNGVVSVAYFTITAAILAPLIRAGEVGRNRLETATAAIFFSCAVGHGLHALHAGTVLGGGVLGGGTRGGGALDSGAPGSDAPVGFDFDTSTVDRLVSELGGDADLRTELLTDYLREGGERIADLTAGGGVGDRGAVGAAAHALRSSSRVLGLGDLAASLARLEAAARTHGVDLAAGVESAAAQYSSAASAVAEWLRSQPGPVLPASATP